jgi:hypothetical protein
VLHSDFVDVNSVAEGFQAAIAFLAIHLNSVTRPDGSDLRTHLPVPLRVSGRLLEPYQYRQQRETVRSRHETDARSWIQTRCLFLLHGFCKLGASTDKITLIVSKDHVVFVALGVSSAVQAVRSASVKVRGEERLSVLVLDRRSELFVTVQAADATVRHIDSPHNNDDEYRNYKQGRKIRPRLSTPSRSSGMLLESVIVESLRRRLCKLASLADLLGAFMKLLCVDCRLEMPDLKAVEVDGIPEDSQEVLAFGAFHRAFQLSMRRTWRA